MLRVGNHKPAGRLAHGRETTENGQSMSLDHGPAHVWQAVLESLRAQLPSSTYRTWVVAAEPVAYENGVLTIGVVNSYAREKLLALDEIPQAAKQVLGHDVRVDVVVPGEPQPTRPRLANLERADQETGSLASAERDVAVASRYLSRYDEIVRPERVVSIPRYYLRWIPYLGVDLAWIPIGFRQVAYFRGLGFEAGDEFQCSHRELAIWSGMSERNLYRKINDPRLGWFIQRADQEMVWSVGKDGAPHREALSWVVMMSMPLTPADQVSLERYLHRAVASGLSKRRALQAAYEAPLDDLLPRADVAEVPEMAGPPRGVEQVVERALGKEILEPETKKLVAALSMKIGGYGESLEITHYFIRHHLPRPCIGGGRGWLVQVLRALSQQQGYPPETVVRGGHGALGSLLGVNAGTVRRWMGETRAGEGGEVGLESFVQYRGVVRYADGSVDLVVRVARDEPVLPEHERATESKASYPDVGTDLLDPSGDGSGAFPVSIEAGPDVQVDSIRGNPAAQPVMHRESTGARVVSIEAQAGVHSVRNEKATQARSLSGLKGVGGSPHPESLDIETNTSFDDDTIEGDAQSGRDGEGRAWDLEGLLLQASVHPATRARLRGASSVAWVSWLLYWASPLGERLLEPTGNAVSRLKEAPTAPMAGAFERLAALGPDDLAKMIVPRVLSRYGDHPSNRDWEDVMSGAPEDRLRRLVDLFGFDLAEWREGEGGRLDG